MRLGGGPKPDPNPGDVHAVGFVARRNQPCTSTEMCHMPPPICFLTWLTHHSERSPTPAGRDRWHGLRSALGIGRAGSEAGSETGSETGSGGILNGAGRDFLARLSVHGCFEQRPDTAPVQHAASAAAEFSGSNASRGRLRVGMGGGIDGACEQVTVTKGRAVTDHILDPIGGGGGGGPDGGGGGSRLPPKQKLPARLPPMSLRPALQHAWSLHTNPQVGSRHPIATGSSRIPICIPCLDPTPDPHTHRYPHPHTHLHHDLHTHPYPHPYPNIHPHSHPHPHPPSTSPSTIHIPIHHPHPHLPFIPHLELHAHPNLDPDPHPIHSSCWSSSLHSIKPSTWDPEQQDPEQRDPEQRDPEQRDPEQRDLDQIPLLSLLPSAHPLRQAECLGMQQVRAEA